LLHGTIVALLAAAGAESWWDEEISRAVEETNR